MKEYTKETQCPQCGADCKITRYFDDVGMVEKDIKCKECGYHYNWAYGYETVECQD